MKFQLFKEVVLLIDIPKKKLRKGDVATVVDYHPTQNGEDGYSLEIFNAVGETVAVITVAESAIKALSKEEVFNVRLLLAA